MEYPGEQNRNIVYREAYYKYNLYPIRALHTYVDNKNNAIIIRPACSTFTNKCPQDYVGLWSAGIGTFIVISPNLS